ncbi:hypothetical protein IJ541_11205 [bacterium]|nr:hypothetical protein [bacterium]
MEFKFDESTLYEHKDNELRDFNSYYIVSKDEEVKDSDFENVIQIIDESGQEVTCTYDKFVEIFDQEGLAGFIM